MFLYSTLGKEIYLLHLVETITFTISKVINKLLLIEGSFPSDKKAL